MGELQPYGETHQKKKKKKKELGEGIEVSC